MRRHALHLALTLISMGTDRVFAFLAVTMILRVFPIAQAGGFVLMLKIAGFTGALATLGLQAGAVSLISRALGDGRMAWADALLRAFLWTRVGTALALCSGGMIGATWVAAHLFDNPSAAPFVEWGCISAATNGILMFSLHHLQARQSFTRYAVLATMASLSKLAAILLLILAGALSAYTAAALWALLPLVGAVGGICLAPKSFITKSRPGETRRARAQLAKYGRWLTASSLVGVIFVNLDSLLVARELGLEEVSWYGAAINLSLTVTVVAAALFTVLLPAVARLSDSKQMRRFFKRALLFTSAGSLLLSPVLAAAPEIIHLVYGHRYYPAVPAFRVLFAGALIAIIYTTAGVIFLAREKFIHVFGQAAVQVVVSVPLYVLLIPRHGIMGGAIGTCAGQVAALIYVLFFGTWVLREKPSEVIDIVETQYAT